MKLKACPNSPNCVSSQSLFSSHQIAPLTYLSSAEQAMKKIKQIILALPHAKLVKENNLSLHVEIQSSLLKFIDDVDVFIDETEKLIHFRSASRTGYWDFGVNRRRIEEIKRKFVTTQLTPN